MSITLPRSAAPTPIPHATPIRAQGIKGRDAFASHQSESISDRNGVKNQGRAWIKQPAYRQDDARHRYYQQEGLQAELRPVSHLLILPRRARKSPARLGRSLHRVQTVVFPSQTTAS
jgi:hypothetical protein